MAGKQLHLMTGLGHEELQMWEHMAQGHSGKNGTGEVRCNCRAVLAYNLKWQAIARKRAQALLRRGKHPYEHRAGD